MLRLRAWVFFGVLLLIGILAVGSSPSFQSCINESAPEATDSGPQKHGTSFVVALSPRGCLGRFFTENRDDIIAAFAVILALSTIFLWFATRDLVAGTQDFSKMQFRAYLGPSETFITGVAAGERPVIESSIRNFGQTPAYRVRYWTDAKVMDTTVERFERIPYEAGEKTINPGRDGFTIKSRVAEPLTEEDMSKIRLGTASVYFYGLITYRDAFGRSRKTQFRLQHGGPRLAGTEDLIISPKGNRAT
jgi:hypothetical protein